MADLTRWEKNSVKSNIVFPIVFVVIAFILVVALFSIKPKPPEIQKKDASTTTEAVAAAASEKIDWEKF